MATSHHFKPTVKGIKRIGQRRDVFDEWSRNQNKLEFAGKDPQ